MRTFLPIFMILVAVAGFFIFTDKHYQNVQALRAQASSYDTALGNAKALQAKRDELVGQYNAFPQTNIDKLNKLLPNNVDNIRLIIEIDAIARKYGMQLKNVKYDDTQKKDATQTFSAPSATDLAAQNKDYGTMSLGFSTQGTYDNFLSFVGDLEKSLRIVDIDSVGFTSVSPTQSTSGSATGISTNGYQYDFTINTYWLKN